MNLRAMREAEVRKRLLRDGHQVPNSVMVQLLRPPGAKQDVTYGEVCGWTRVSGLAAPPKRNGDRIEIDDPPPLDLLDVLRLTK